LLSFFRLSFLCSHVTCPTANIVNGFIAMSRTALPDFGDKPDCSSFGTVRLAERRGGDLSGAGES